MMRTVRKLPVAACAVALAAAGMLAVTGVRAQNKGGQQGAPGKHMTGVFKGAKVNAGTVMHETKDGKSMLTLSDDFKTPETPDPHWQVVDSNGHVYLLNRLMKKGGLVGGDALNKSITVPSYVPDVAKVQVWCAWAEALLGEASFESPVK